MKYKHDNGNGKKERKRRFNSLSSVVMTKPLSVNRAYTGRKRRSVWLKGFNTRVLRELPKGSIPNKGNLTLTITCGVSNRRSDLDNLLKPFIDCLQLAYGFDDSQIYYITARKKIVRKGDEYINWRINKYHGKVDER